MKKLRNLGIELPENLFKIVYLGEVESKMFFYKAQFEYLRKTYKSKSSRSKIDNYFNKFFEAFREDESEAVGYASGLKLTGFGNKSNKTRLSLSFIAYRKGLSPTEKVYVEGHEETHIIDEYKHLNLLENRLRTEKIDIDLQRYDKEHRAVIGGLYALASNKADNEVTFEKLRDPIQREALYLAYLLGI